MWTIDEYARRGRSWVWLRPPQAPKRLLAIASSMMRVRWEMWSVLAQSPRGASFCQVIRRSPMGQGIPAITAGNQW